MQCAVTTIGESADALHRATRGYGAYHRILTSSPIRLSGGRLSLAASLRTTSMRASDATSRRPGPIGTGGAGCGTQDKGRGRLGHLCIVP